MKFFKELFCEDTDRTKPCIRRVMGALGFLAGIIAMFIPHIAASQYNVLISASVVLMGVTTLDKFAANAGKSKKTE